MTQDNSESNSFEENRSVFEWSQEDTAVLLDLYGSNLANVGPLKKFRNKKQLWCFISKELEKKGFNRTPGQCENRFKTVIKRKKKVDHHNSQTGNSPCELLLPFEEQLSNIVSTDDTITSPIRIGVGHHYSDNNVYVMTDMSPGSSSSTPPLPQSPSTTENSSETKRKKKTIAETIEVFLAETQKTKKARHEERMGFLKTIFGPHVPQFNSSEEK